jgi:hypothetical protein
MRRGANRRIGVGIAAVVVLLCATAAAEAIPIPPAVSSAPLRGLGLVTGVPVVTTTDLVATLGPTGITHSFPAPPGATFVDSVTVGSDVVARYSVYGACTASVRDSSLADLGVNVTVPCGGQMAATGTSSWAILSPSTGGSISLTCWGLDGLSSCTNEIPAPVGGTQAPLALGCTATNCTGIIVNGSGAAVAYLPLSGAAPTTYPLSGHGTAALVINPTSGTGFTFTLETGTTIQPYALAVDGTPTAKTPFTMPGASTSASWLRAEPLGDDIALGTVDTAGSNYDVPWVVWYEQTDTTRDVARQLFASNWTPSFVGLVGGVQNAYLGVTVNTPTGPRSSIRVLSDGPDVAVDGAEFAVAGHWVPWRTWYQTAPVVAAPSLTPLGSLQFAPPGAELTAILHLENDGTVAATGLSTHAFGRAFAGSLFHAETSAPPGPGLSFSVELRGAGHDGLASVVVPRTGIPLSTFSVDPLDLFADNFGYFPPVHPKTEPFDPPKLRAKVFLTGELRATQAAAAGSGVDIAVMRRHGSKCSWLTGHRGRFAVDSTCVAPRWLATTGSASQWKYRVSTLKHGKVVVLVRRHTGDPVGALEFGRALSNLFVVKI